MQPILITEDGEIYMTEGIAVWTYRVLCFSELPY